MAFKINDRVRQDVVVGGLGNVVFNGMGAVPGFTTFTSSMSVGDTTYYFIYDPISFNYEVGTGTYASGDQLQRTAVFDSTNDGSLVNFPGNVCQVAMTIPANLVLAGWPAGPAGPPGPSGPNTYIVPVSWLSGSDPAGTIVWRAPAGMTVTSVVGRVEIAEGTASTLQPVIVDANATIDATTTLTTTLFDCNGTVGADQTLTLISTPTLTAGQYVGMVGAGTFGSSQGNITFIATEP